MHIGISKLIAILLIAITAMTGLNASGAAAPAPAPIVEEAQGVPEDTSRLLTAEEVEYARLDLPAVESYFAAQSNCYVYISYLSTGNAPNVSARGGRNCHYLTSGTLTVSLWTGGNRFLGSASSYSTGKADVVQTNRWGCTWSDSREWAYFVNVRFRASWGTILADREYGPYYRHYGC